jgi:hypothetical protein
MKLPKLTELGVREKVMISVMGVALIGMFLSVMSWWFLSGLDGLQREQGPLEKRIRDARKLIKSQEPISADYQQVESMLGVSLSDAESIADMKEDVEDMARGAGLDCDPPSHREPVADPSLPWREYTVQLARCDGTMDALISFIGALEGAPFVYRVEKMTVAPAKKGGGITASVIVSRIMLPPEEQPVEAGEEG